jgi:hypothetical protein
MQWFFNQPLAFGLTLAVMLCVALELRYRVSVHSRLLEDSNRKDQLSTVRDGLFVLVSLLLGFTVALAGARLVERRSLLVEEAVSIGTSYLPRRHTPPAIPRSITKPFVRLLGVSPGAAGCAT